jgi:AraC-like DNA-binding protein
VAGACALDAHALLSEVGLPGRCLADPDLLIPAQPVGRLLELAARRGNEPSFGLRMAQSRRLSNLGPLGLLLRDEPTLRHALEAIVANMHLHNEALSLQVEEMGNLVAIRAELATEDGKPYRQATELVIGVMFRTLEVFMGAQWRPRLVCFTHRAPQSLSLYLRVFGSAVEFGHAFNGIICNAADVDAPNPGADPVMARYTNRLLRSKPRRKPRVSDRVREHIILLLPRGHCRVEVVAQHLGIDRRTVARHLAGEGTTFTALLDEVRRDLLTQYLEDGARPIGEVAALLGFAEPSAFSRWHRQQFGVTARSRMAVQPGWLEGRG